MAKNSTAARKSEGGTMLKNRPPKRKRALLYPLEPTSIDPRRIDAAVAAVIAKRKSK